MRYRSLTAHPMFSGRAVRSCRVVICWSADFGVASCFCTTSTNGVIDMTIGLVDTVLGGSLAEERLDPGFTLDFDASDNPFGLGVEIVPEVVGSAGRGCTTNDGCDPSCASSCTSSSC